MKHKRDDGAEKHDDETVDVTPIMICVFVVMCCSMLVLLYFFYDHLGTFKVVFVLIHLHYHKVDIVKEHFIVKKIRKHLSFVMCLHPNILLKYCKKTH